MASVRHAATFGVLLMLSLSTHAQVMPTGCSYDSGLYECDYSTLSGSSLIPLAASGFSPIPQRLRLVGLPTALNTAVFASDFENFTLTDYDTNYPSSLELACENGGDLTLASGFLQYMGHIEEFKVSNCDMGNIPTAAFTGLGDVDRFIFENGSVGTVSADMLNGVNIRRNTSASPGFPKHHGQLVWRNTKVSGSFPAAILTGQSSLYELVLRNINLTTLDATLFTPSPGLRYLDLSYNGFSELPSSYFADVPSLGVITMYGLEVECTCSKLWFLGYAKDNYLTLNGDIVCSSASSASWIGKLGWQYYEESCVTVEEACGGIAMMDACLSAIDIAGFSVGFVGFVMGWVVLGITIHTRRQLGPGGAKGKGGKKPGAGGAKRPPVKKGAGGSKKGWA